MRFASLVGIVAACDGDHSALKPAGFFYGLLSHTSASGKTWNDMEIQMNFKESTLDMVWWFGVKNALVSQVPKQVFACSNVAYVFGLEEVSVGIDIGADACLSAIAAKFPAGIISDYVTMPIDHESGDLVFALAGGAVSMEMYPTKGSITIPSGIDGLAPADTPARRCCAETTSETNESEETSTDAPVATVQADATTTTSTTKTAATLSGVAAVLAIVALVL